jgi:hypothetical protein
MVIGLISMAKTVCSKVMVALAGGPSGTKSRGVDVSALLPMDHAKARNKGFDSSMIDLHRAASDNDLANLDSTASYVNTIGLAGSEVSGTTRQGRTILTGLIEALSKMPGS